MAKITPIWVTEQFQHFLEDLKESFWGELYGQTRQDWKRFFDGQSLRERERNFIPVGLEKFQRRAEDAAKLIREALLRDISTRQVGRIVATFTGEPVSAQTVPKLTRELDEAVRKFHQARLKDEWVYLFLDGVSLRVRQPAGRKRVQMLSG